MPVYKTQSDFAKAVGRHQGTVSRDMSNPDCPVRDVPPWDEDDKENYTDWVMSRGRAPLDDRLKLEQIRKASALADKYEHEYARATKDVVVGSDVVRVISTAFGELRDQLLVMAHSIAPLCEGKLVEDIERQIAQHTTKTLNGVADRLEQFTSGIDAVSGSSESDQAAAADESERVGGEASVHAQEPDGQSRPVEE